MNPTTMETTRVIYCHCNLCVIISLLPILPASQPFPSSNSSLDNIPPPSFLPSNLSHLPILLYITFHLPPSTSCLPASHHPIPLWTAFPLSSHPSRMCIPFALILPSNFCTPYYMSVNIWIQGISFRFISYRQGSFIARGVSSLLDELPSN